MTKYYLGVDGGGTNCRIRLTDEQLVTLGEGRGGPSNLQIQNGEPAYRSILEGARAAFAAAGLGEADFGKAYGCFCMAGGRSVIDREAFQQRPWPFAGVRIYDDIDAAHAGALGGEEGAVIIAGTGSAALAIVEGQRHQCGGWGFHVGDQMSGAILGRELVRRAVEARDGLVSGSPLTEAVIEALGGSNDAVMDWSFPKPATPVEFKDEAGNELPVTVGRAPKAYGDFSRMIFDYYEKGDPVARELIALELSYVDNYVRWFKERRATRMAATGGVGERLFPLLVERYGSFIVKPLGDNLSGAVILAKQNFAA
ncbi:MAG TPA: BadF/BadG/BcrA/BcrD ATPase family protein [Devosia sp.]|nr:BadF/BadG/BcrA/BcrD ATPase family protein [Devosia sp.]